MHTAMSAMRTGSESVSASEWTMSDSRPSSLHARMTRTAISPRFATSTLCNVAVIRASGVGLDHDEHLAELHRLAVCHANLLHGPADAGRDGTHELHHF